MAKEKKNDTKRRVPFNKLISAFDPNIGQSRKIEPHKTKTGTYTDKVLNKIIFIGRIIKKKYRMKKEEVTT